MAPSSGEADKPTGKSSRFTLGPAASPEKEKSRQTTMPKKRGWGRRTSNTSLQDDHEDMVAIIAKRIDDANQSEGGYNRAVDPESRRYWAWLIFMCVVCFYTSCEATYTIAFFRHYQGYYSLLPFSYLTDVVFLVHIGLQFRVGYFEPNGAKQLNRQLAMRHYTRSARGWIEMASAIPLDVLQLFTGWTPFVRVLKILRLYSMPEQLRMLSATSVTPRSINIITIVRMAFLWLVLSHSAACVRLLFAAVEGYGGVLPSGAGDPSAAPEAIDTWNLDISLKDRSTGTQYLHSLYWCMGLMTGTLGGIDRGTCIAPARPHASGAARSLVCVRACVRACVCVCVCTRLSHTPMPLPPSLSVSARRDGRRRGAAEQRAVLFHHVAGHHRRPRLRLLRRCDLVDLRVSDGQGGGGAAQH